MTIQELERLALSFLEVDSTSGREGEYGELLVRCFERLGYPVERQEVAPNRFNVAVDAHGKSLLFSTHIDTVPPHLPAHFDELALHGRGACDTKGILACMIAAGESLRAEGIHDFGYLLVVGEEVDGCGARAANEVYRARHLVVGEPTERKLALGHKGVAKFRLEVDGVSGHSAYPGSGRSAIHALHRLLGSLFETKHEQDELLGASTINVGRIGGGHAANVIADHAWAECMIRSVVDKEIVRERVERLIGAEGRVEWMALKNPARMRAVGDFPTTVVGFSSDIPYMQDVGEAHLYGPGSILHAHTADEHILRQDMIAAVDDYVRLAKLLLAEDV